MQKRRALITMGMYAGSHWQALAYMRMDAFMFEAGDYR
uniref:Uncharacterized protein n=1 Tax=Arundo donax TaxID=35708 RepID=A0A0A8Y9G6_ARUDO